MSKVLAIGDIHAPATHPGYLTFCKDVYHEWGCDTVVFMGDVIDHQAISFHANNPQCALTSGSVHFLRHECALGTMTNELFVLLNP
jgi:predicted phosphodiesterase